MQKIQEDGWPSGSGNGAHPHAISPLQLAPLPPLCSVTRTSTAQGTYTADSDADPRLCAPQWLASTTMASSKPLWSNSNSSRKTVTPSMRISTTLLGRPRARSRSVSRRWTTKKLTIQLHLRSCHRLPLRLSAIFLPYRALAYPQERGVRKHFISLTTDDKHRCLCRRKLARRSRSLPRSSPCSSLCCWLGSR